MDEYIQVMGQSVTQEALITAVVAGLIPAFLMGAFAYSLQGIKSALVASLSVFLVISASFFFLISSSELKETKKEAELQKKYEEVTKELLEDNTQSLARLIRGEFCLLKTDQRVDRENCEKLLVEIADPNMKE